METMDTMTDWMAVNVSRGLATSPPLIPPLCIAAIWPMAVTGI